jgi:hypothetical protein
MSFIDGEEVPPSKPRKRKKLQQQQQQQQQQQEGVHNYSGKSCLYWVRASTMSCMK